MIMAVIRRVGVILCVLVLAGTAAVWVRSYFKADEVAVDWRHRGCNAAAHSGAAVIGAREQSSIGFFHCWHESSTLSDVASVDDRFPRRPLGFSYEVGRIGVEQHVCIRFPLWFPTFAS